DIEDINRLFKLCYIKYSIRFSDSDANFKNARTDDGHRFEIAGIISALHRLQLKTDSLSNFLWQCAHIVARCADPFNRLESRCPIYLRYWITRILSFRAFISN